MNQTAPYRPLSQRLAPDVCLTQARRMLLRRGYTNETMAAAIDADPTHVSRVVCGEYRNGKVWKRLARHLLDQKQSDIVKLLERVTPPRKAARKTAKKRTRSTSSGQEGGEA